MKSFFLSLLLLASQFTFVLAQPSSPFSSENDVAALRAIKRRQATSKQIVERMRAGPRRRTDPSAVPQPVCSSANLIVNGDFQTANPTHVEPWRLVLVPRTMSTTIVYSGPFVYADPNDTGAHWSFFTAATGPGVMTLAQDVAPQLSQKYTLVFQLGAYSYGQNSCPITVSAGDKSVTFNNYCRTGDTSCVRVGTNLPTFKQQTLSDITFPSSTSTVSFVFDCSALPVTGDATVSNRASYRYIVDNVSLKC